MVGHAGSPTCIVHVAPGLRSCTIHVDMTLTKVNVTGLLNFRKLSKIAENCTFLGHYPAPFWHGAQN